VKRNLLYIQRTPLIRNPDFRQLRTLEDATAAVGHVRASLPDLLVAEVQNAECEVFALRVGEHCNLTHVLNEHLGRFHNALEARIVQCYVDSDTVADTVVFRSFILGHRLKGWTLLKEESDGSAT
jgi:hypothetical protein